MSSSSDYMIQERVDDDPLGIQIACDGNPDFGVPISVATVIWWVTLAGCFTSSAINVYFLEDGKSLTLVDTGVRSTECRDALKAALSHSDFHSHKLKRIICHSLPSDHIGLAGEFAREGVELWTSRSTWLNCHLLSNNKQL